jgi:hypothetical protein
MGDVPNALERGGHLDASWQQLLQHLVSAQVAVVKLQIEG